MPITRSELLAPAYCICLGLESGVSFDIIAQGAGVGKYPSLMRLLAGNDSEMLDELNPEAAEFLKSFTELRLLSESSGTPFNRVMVPLLLSEGHEGFCVDPKGKMILRKISLVIATGESPWDAIRFVLGLPEGKRIHPEVAIIMLKEELKEEELSEILELSVNFFNWGGNYCDFLEFLAGKNKL